MFIHEMAESECRAALDRAAVGRLACAKDNQPYVVPIYFVLDRDHLYSFATLGQKVEWMRANPRVCLEVDQRTAHDSWESVVVFGEYEELPDLPEQEAARFRAYELLQKHPMWWEPGVVSQEHRDIPHSAIPVFYRINITRLTGHRATPKPYGSASEVETESKAKDGWWAEILRHLGVAD
jgi:nitroimidazol reductase NimA-like FMN-containing flavoprotein (pyridoxamine 5'-phosphate oxidase superfamily)